jgi:small ligand-binding sensory domain FIST
VVNFGAVEFAAPRRLARRLDGRFDTCSNRATRDNKWMRFYCAVSDDESARDAVGRVITDSRATNGAVDAVFAFVTGHFAEDADDILERLWLELDPQALIGCSAEGVIGGDREIERAPGISILVAELPDVRLHPFHIAGRSEWREILNDEEQLKDRVGLGPQTQAIIAMGDPFTTPIDPFMAALDKHAPGVPLVGGMASAAQQPGDNFLFRNDQRFDQGLVGMSLSGPIAVETIVSQGCRPIGSHMVVTRSHDNVIEQLGGKPALRALQDAIDAITAHDRELLENGLLIGRAISEYREKFGRGDFLVRNVVGVEQDSGAIAVADYVKTGQTVQFHVRDAASADEDLKLLLDSRKLAAPAGGLLFSCNGRGTRLFDEPCHDVGAARGALKAAPIAGFFAAGELGPVGGRNFIHGHTASIALFSASQ